MLLMLPHIKEDNSHEPIALKIPPPVSLKYDLFGVISHYGSFYDGHYTSICKDLPLPADGDGNANEGNWCTYNDEDCKEWIPASSDEDIISQQVYVMFYQLQNMPPLDSYLNTMYQQQMYTDASSTAILKTVTMD